jgi:hypothetical protein
VDTFVDKNVLKYRFCGILLSTWDNFSGQILFLNLLIVPVAAVFGVAFHCGQDKIILTGAVGILTSALLILVDKSINLPAKRKMLQLNLLDYMENFCKVRLEQEAYHPELLEQAKREYAQVSEAKKQVGAAKEEEKDEVKEEINRRKEAKKAKEEEKKKKEEDKKLQAQKREEEHRKLEEARRVEEQRKLEERRQLAAKRREEELKKLEEERQALEIRRAELQKKTLERQAQKQKKDDEKEKEKQMLLHSMEQELKSTENRTDMNKVLEGLDEIAANKEQAQIESAIQNKFEGIPLDTEAAVGAKKAKAEKVKNQEPEIVEDKLIEDVLKEFFA